MPLSSLLRRFKQPDIQQEYASEEKERGWVCRNGHLTIYPSYVSFKSHRDIHGDLILPMDLELPVTLLTCSDKDCYEPITYIWKPPTSEEWRDPVDRTPVKAGTIQYLVGQHRVCDGLDAGKPCLQSLGRPHPYHWVGFSKSWMTQSQYEFWLAEHSSLSSRHTPRK